MYIVIISVYSTCICICVCIYHLIPLFPVHEVFEGQSL